MENAERLDLEPEPRYVRWAFPWKRKPSRKAVLIALAALTIAVGLFFGWGWVAAAGLSPVVLGLLPCVAMCAAGLCMNRFGQKTACAGRTEISVPKPPDVAKPIAIEEIETAASSVEENATRIALRQDRK
jgi:hypothetical protein